MKTTKQKLNYLFSLFTLTVLIFFATDFDCFGKGKKSNSVEKANKKLIETYSADFWNNHNFDAFDKYFATDFVGHFDDGDQNCEKFKGLCKAYLSAFPDIHVTNHYIIAEGNKVAKIFTTKGTQKSDFMGIPAAGKRMEVFGIEMFRIEDGKIAELWISMDNLGMMQQLDVIPNIGE